MLVVPDVPDVDTQVRVLRPQIKLERHRDAVSQVSLCRVDSDARPGQRPSPAARVDDTHANAQPRKASTARPGSISSARAFAAY